MASLMDDALEKRMPRLYSQENNEDPMVHVRYYHRYSAWEWFGIEYDPKKRLFFGLVKGFVEELGYFSLDELESVNVHGATIERDDNFIPVPLSKIRGEGSSVANLKSAHLAYKGTKMDDWIIVEITEAWGMKVASPLFEHGKFSTEKEAKTKLYQIKRKLTDDAKDAGCYDSYSLEVMQFKDLSAMQIEILHGIFASGKAKGYTRGAHLIKPAKDVHDWSIEKTAENCEGCEELLKKCGAKGWGVEKCERCGHLYSPEDPEMGGECSCADKDYGHGDFDLEPEEIKPSMARAKAISESNRGFGNLDNTEKILFLMDSRLTSAYNAWAAKQKKIDAAKDPIMKHVIVAKDLIGDAINELRITRNFFRESHAPTLDVPKSAFIVNLALSRGDVDGESGKINNIKSITFGFSEGAVKEGTVNSFKEANKILRDAARQAPADGSYHKTDVILEWENGFRFYHRFDLQRKHQWVDLGKEVEAYMNYLANRDPYISKEKRDSLKEMMERLAFS